jgi:Ni/Co efflux regulator RcnB
MRKTAIMVAAATALTMGVTDAQAQTRDRTTTVEGPRGNSASRSVTVERWHRPPPPRSYSGPRAGHYFAPGYGYYHVAPAYYRRRWVVGAAVPPVLRRYVVIDPAVYRLPPAPPHLRWIYVGNRIALVRTSDGVIVQLGPVFW